MLTLTNCTKRIKLYLRIITRHDNNINNASDKLQEVNWD